MAASLHAVAGATSANQPRGQSGGGNEITAIFHHSLTANASANDVFQCIKIPSGAVVTGGYIIVDSTDAFTLLVGDGANTSRYIGATSSVSASQTYHDFGRDLSGQLCGLGHKYTADDTIDVKLTAVTATVALDWTLCIKYVLDGQTGGVASS